MSILIETNFNSVECVSESIAESQGKFWYITGVFAQEDVVNRNRRIYPRQVMEKCFEDYQKEFVSTGRAVGELTHPATTVINLDRVTHLITELRKEGSNYIGKARILNTPCGKVVQALLEGGVKLGVSTRADGTVKKNSQGIDEVQEGLKMACIDVVLNPSAPDAFVTGLMEGADFVWEEGNADQSFIQTLKEEFEQNFRRQREMAKLKAFRSFMEHIRTK